MFLSQINKRIKNKLTNFFKLHAEHCYIKCKIPANTLLLKDFIRQNNLMVMSFTSTRTKASRGQKPVDLSVTLYSRRKTSKKLRSNTQKLFVV